VNDAHGLPQTVFVLGGTSDIARAVVARLVARRTRTVILAGRDPAGLDKVAAELTAAGADRVELVPFEAADPTSHAALVDGVFDRHGDIDLVLVAFGVLGDQRAIVDDPDAGAALAQVNYVAAVSTGLAVARRLRAQGHGTVVALSSVAGERPRRANFVYGSSKAGMDAFFTGLGDELHGRGVRVVVVRPGFVRTRMTAGLPSVPFATTPEAVADAVVGALASGAETVWVPAILRWVMVVARHLPRPLFRRWPA
jgi:decaprenylphospho-beta-D-erythro-pentofuranosid-2-ulose 2-reductase